MIAPMLVAIVLLGFTPIIFESALAYALAAPLGIAGFIAPLAVVAESRLLKQESGMYCSMWIRGSC